MRNWLKKISSKFTLKDEDGIHPISAADAKVIELVLEVLSGKGELVADLSDIIEDWKNGSTDITVQDRLTQLIAEIEEGGDIKYHIKLNGISMPVKELKTIKEHREYCYDHNVNKCFVLINESDSTSPTKFDNIKIKCASEYQMISKIEEIERFMNKFKIKFVSI